MLLLPKLSFTTIYLLKDPQHLLWGQYYLDAETKDVTEKMAQVEVDLSDTAMQNNSTARQLDTLQAEAESLDNTVKELAEQLEFIKNSDIRGEHFF